MPHTTYSVVIPLYNEADSLTVLWRQIKQAMRRLQSEQTDWEAIFINDGSHDTSIQVLQKLAQKESNIKVISFRKNKGKAAALQAGFQLAQGDIIVTLDADLQDDPKEIVRLINKLNEGNDLVTGLKQHRRDPIHKTVPSFVFNALVRRVSGTSFRDINSGLKAYRKPVIQQLNLYGELYRFIPILVANEGFKVAELPVNHRPRQFGTSKYGITRFVRGLLDLFTVTFLTRFVKRPLHLFGSLGLIFLAVGVTVCSYLTFIHFAYGARIGTRPLLTLGVLFIIAGIQLISTGLIAELLTYYAHKLRPSQPDTFVTTNDHQIFYLNDSYDRDDTTR